MSTLEDISPRPSSFDLHESSEDEAEITMEIWQVQLALKLGAQYIALNCDEKPDWYSVIEKMTSKDFTIIRDKGMEVLGYYDGIVLFGASRPLKHGEQRNVNEMPALHPVFLRPREPLPTRH